MTEAIRRADARRTETPNAVMTTLASPTQGSTSLAVWRVDMKAGKTGPDHAFDVEQIWTWLAGSATVSVDSRPIDVREGDTLVIPAGAWRQVHTDAGFTAVVAATGGSRVTTTDGRDPFVPPWIA